PLPHYFVPNPRTAAGPARPQEPRPRGQFLFERQRKGACQPRPDSRRRLVFSHGRQPAPSSLALRPRLARRCSRSINLLEVFASLYGQLCAMGPPSDVKDRTTDTLRRQHFFWQKNTAFQQGTAF